MKYYILLFALTGAFLLQSCNEDEIYDIMGSAENIVYINTRSWSPIDAPKNSSVFDVINTPVGSIISDAESIEVTFDVHCTQSAAENITISFLTDNSLICDGYSVLPEAITWSLDKASLTIAKGSSVSDDSITVTLAADLLGDLDDGSYMLPVKISSIDNAVASSSLYAVYLIVNTQYSNCVDKATGVSGTAATDKSAWTATADGTDQGTKLFDNRRSTYYFGSDFTVEVDLGSVYSDITGLEMGFYMWYYAMGSADIYTSDTSADEYVFQGSPTFPASTPQYVSFYSPVNARYIKVVVTSPSYNSSYGTAMTEFGIYQ